MKKFITQSIMLLFLSVGMMTYTMAQTAVSGNVSDSNSGSPLIGVNVYVENTVLGTTTDANGDFSLSVNQDPPFNVVFSMVGMDRQVYPITSGGANLKVKLLESSIFANEVVISASRFEERIQESPVSIEKMDALEIRNTSSPSFYDGIANLKGVQQNASSLTFKSYNTRGFATIANVRFVQLLDGMDVSPPGLNFPVGNIAGVSELDVRSVELIPGASSALYGPNAFNGILMLETKSPFDYQGLSAYVKSGLTTQDAAGTNPFVDAGLRYAKAWNNKVAVKFNVAALNAEDWHANNFEDINDPTKSVTDPDYDGVNIYGSGVSTTLNFDQLSGAPAGTFGSQTVARTGYKESELVDYETSNYKGDVALHYRLSDDVEASYQFRASNGKSIYQGFSRYAIDNFWIYNHKLELKSDEWNVRGYTTIEDAGDTYDPRFAAWNINRDWKSDPEWFEDYATTYIGALSGLVPGGPYTSEQAHALARQQADVGRLIPGTPEFEEAFNRITDLTDLATGSKFLDKSTLTHVEGNYDFKNLLDVIGLQVGANWRQYNLKSEGTIFNDVDPETGAKRDLTIDEYGAYIQASKSFADDRLKLQASARVDKNANFDSQVSPRASIVYTAGADREHNIRASYQTGFRNPDTQTQFINLNLGPAVLLGTTQENMDIFSLTNSSGTYSGDNLLSNIYTTTSALAFSDSTSSPMIQQQAAINASASLQPGWQADGTAIATQMVIDGLLTPEEVPGFVQNYVGGQILMFSQDPANLAAIGAQVVGLSSAALVKANVGFIKPEQVKAFEIGYRGIINNKLKVDVNYYRNEYEDFQVTTNVVAIANEAIGSGSTLEAAGGLAVGASQVFQLYTNADDKVTSQGFGIGLDYLLNGGWSVGGSYNNAKFDIQDANPDLIPGFNTPENRFNLRLANRKITDRIGANVAYRWSGDYLWEATFGNGPVDSYGSLDAAVSYKLPQIKSQLKIGGANLLGTEYRQAFGAPAIGSQFFISLLFDELMN